MKLRKNGKIKFSSEYKYWEFMGFLSEVNPYFSHFSINYPVCKEMAIGFQRYKTNRSRHMKSTSNFMQMQRYLESKEKEREEE